MKYCLFVYLFILMTNIACVQNDNSIKLLNIIKLNNDESLKPSIIYKNMFINNDSKYMIRYDLLIYVKGKEIKMKVYLRPKHEHDIEIIKKYDNFTVSNASINFGQGSEYSLLQKFGKSYKTTKGIQMKKYTNNIGGEIANDLLVYNFDLQNKYFDNCLIVFQDMWIKFNDYEEKLNISLIDNLLTKNDIKVEQYRIINHWIETLSVL